MNTQNYASLEASKRLHDAGIVLETEFCWARDDKGWYFRSYENYEREVLESVSAPSMAEVLEDNGTCCGYSIEDHIIFSTRADNPTDALIDLLIWVRKEVRDEIS